MLQCFLIQKRCSSNITKAKAINKALKYTRLSRVNQQPLETCIFSRVSWVQSVDSLKLCPLVVADMHILETDRWTDRQTCSDKQVNDRQVNRHICSILTQSIRTSPCDFCFYSVRKLLDTWWRNNDLKNSAAAISLSKPKSYGNNMYENESWDKILSSGKCFVP